MKKKDTFLDLLDKISSKSPVPGGGSVAALSGSLGASCIMMVCNLTIGKKKYKGVEARFKDILKEAGSIQEELLFLSEMDTKAFEEVMEAINARDDDKSEDKLQEAYKKAANVPLESAKKCLRLLELADITTKKGNINTQTDSGVGALMAFAGLKGAILNVRVNLKYISDENFVIRMKEEIDSLEGLGEDLFKTQFDHILNTVS